MLKQFLEVVIEHGVVPRLLALPGLARPHDPLDSGDGGRGRGQAKREEDTEDRGLGLIIIKKYPLILCQYYERVHAIDLRFFFLNLSRILP